MTTLKKTLVTFGLTISLAGSYAHSGMFNSDAKDYPNAKDRNIASQQDGEVEAGENTKTVAKATRAPKRRPYQHRGVLAD